MPVYRVKAFLYGLDYFESPKELAFVEAPSENEARELARQIPGFTGTNYDNGIAEGSVTPITIYDSVDSIINSNINYRVIDGMKTCKFCTQELLRFKAQNKREHGIRSYHSPSDYCVICDHLRSGRHT